MAKSITIFGETGGVYVLVQHSFGLITTVWCTSALIEKSTGHCLTHFKFFSTHTAFITFEYMLFEHIYLS